MYIWLNSHLNEPVSYNFTTIILKSRLQTDLWLQKSTLTAIRDRDRDGPSSLTAIRYRDIMITSLWNCPFWGHLIIKPSLDSNVWIAQMYGPSDGRLWVFFRLPVCQCIDTIIPSRLFTFNVLLAPFYFVETNPIPLVLKL